MHVCPVEIEHIPKIVGMRQSQVLDGKPVPRTSSTRSSGTWRRTPIPGGSDSPSGPTGRTGSEVPLLADRPGAEYLFWVGCAGSFDEEGKKTARAFASLLKKAGIDFAILGAEEKCCGDSARRLGNEYLFQTLAAETIELFAARRVRKILTICPHGYNTFKNEYPALLEHLPAVSDEAKAHYRTIEVIHHAEFLDGLVRDGRLRLRRERGRPPSPITIPATSAATTASSTRRARSSRESPDARPPSSRTTASTASAAAREAG